MRVRPVALATLILLVPAVGGASASAATPKPKPKPKVTKHKAATKKGARGPAGRKGSAGAKGATGATGPAGPQGSTGPNGPAGASGPAGPVGAPGPAGAPGAFGTLPSGQTERGTFAGEDDNGAVGASPIAYAPIGFPLSLASTPTLIISTVGSVPGCPGTAVQPEAAPGNLCVYVSASNGLVTGFDPATAITGAASRYGTVLTSVTLGSSWMYGTWAVTAA
jgi:hypothetical protein